MIVRLVCSSPRLRLACTTHSSSSLDWLISCQFLLGLCTSSHYIHIYRYTTTKVTSLCITMSYAIMKSHPSLISWSASATRLPSMHPNSCDEICTFVFRMRVINEERDEMMMTTQIHIPLTIKTPTYLAVASMMESELYDFIAFSKAPAIWLSGVASNWREIEKGPAQLLSRNSIVRARGLQDFVQFTLGSLRIARW